MASKPVPSRRKKCLVQTFLFFLATQTTPLFSHLQLLKKTFWPMSFHCRASTVLRLLCNVAGLKCVSWSPTIAQLSNQVMTSQFKVGFKRLQMRFLSLVSGFSNCVMLQCSLCLFR